jgi:hypothetical protein
MCPLRRSGVVLVLFPLLVILRGGCFQRTELRPGFRQSLSSRVALGRQNRRGKKRNVQQSNAWPVTEVPQNCAEQLSRFFSNVIPVRVPVQVTALRPGKARLREATVLEFGGTEHAIFLSTLPLEFADRVKVEGAQNTEAAEGSVVAVQYHEGRKAVAIRFLHGPCHWVTQT